MKITCTNFIQYTGKDHKIIPVILIMIFLFLGQFSFGQKKVLDLSVVPLTPDTTVFGDSTKLMVQFKINSPDSVQNIIMKFGTEQDSADVAVINPGIALINTEYYTVFNGLQNEIVDYDARVYYTLSESQINTYNYLTLYVAYTDGTSDTLYWLKLTPNP